jgi:acetyl esterase/lipase
MAANPGIDMLTRRAMLDALQELASEPVEVTYEEILAAGQRALWVNPLGAAVDRVILFLHGGGFIAGSINCHRKLAAHLAKATGCRALIPAYRLAPESPFPAQLDDAFGIYQWLLRSRRPAALFPLARMQRTQERDHRRMSTAKLFDGCGADLGHAI